MGISHFIVAGLYGSFGKSWPSHKAAGWVAVVFVWIYEINFGYSWGVSIVRFSKPILVLTEDSLELGSL
jgi:hypothetical protein